MPSLEQDPKSKRYHLRFRYAGREFKRFLKTQDYREALTLQLRMEETQRLVEQGRLIIPPDADPVAFLLSDGRVTQAEPEQLVSLGELLDSYHDSLPVGAKEESTLYTEAIHMQHLKRLMKDQRPAVSLGLSDLQAYVNKRLLETRHGKPISGDTVKKEIAMLRVVWNWAADLGHLEKAFPSRGLVFPKRSEKLPFMTWDEITRVLRRGGIDAAEEAELWDSLFLRKEEIDELIEYLGYGQAQRFVLPMVLLAAHTGARRSEIVRSRLDDFDFQAGLVKLREKKRSRHRSVTFRCVDLPPSSESRS
ncbi:MAG: tyrosine-type recombinase/integrase [Planctomycetota bacterium]